MKKFGKAFAAGVTVYVLLLFALVASEASHADSAIHTFADALWYSVVTMTTVGYGDMYPVSAAGKMIGFVFLLLSVSVLAFLISAVLSLLRGRLYPRIIMLQNKRREWFVFSEVNEASRTLADHIAHENKDALFIFCCEAAAQEQKWYADRKLYVAQTPEEVVDGFPAAAQRHVFLISGDFSRNCDEALGLLGRQAKLYCLSEESACQNDILFFDPFECCARQFWQEHPIASQENCIVLIGDGQYAQAILSQALLVNCREPFAAAQYHVFGCWDSYRCVHSQLEQALCIDRTEAEKDSLFFHPQRWEAYRELMRQASRIILCDDDEEENIRTAQTLRRYYASSGQVFVRTSHQLAADVCFGGVQQLYTPELVMKSGLDRIARQMHQLYCSSAESSAPAWEALDGFLRASNRAAADHLATKIRLLLPQLQKVDMDAIRRAAQLYRQSDEQQIERCRRNEHQRWMRFHFLYGWQYAPQKDNAARFHPCLVPYEELDQQEQAKDDYAWRQLEQLAACDEEKVLS